MNITLSNSLKRKKEIFVPIDEKNVRMYVCGPTVYDRAHIGNARAVVVFDVLYRVMRHKYGASHVKYVRNITDVDDKINAAAAKIPGSEDINKKIEKLTTATTEMFHADMAALNCLLPDVEPRATTHIPEMLDMIDKLIANGNAYAANGHVLFRVSSDPKYGHLSGRSTDEMVAGARVEVAPYKENPMDFVLWKPSAADEPGWDSKYGKGRPGWHIECSAMSVKHLGETFDIHGGGADLTFPHHENEIAQSCCAYPGSEYAKFWVHNGFLSVNGEKMSKSLGNFFTVRELLDNDGIPGPIIRYALLATHYRKPLDWTDKALKDAEKAVDKIYQGIFPDNDKSSYDAINGKAPEEFIAALYDDLNTPKAISIMHDLVKKKDSESLKACANIIGLFSDLDYANYADDRIGNNRGFVGDNKKIEELIEARRAARAAKNWAESDRIRDELAAMGVIVEDKAGGMEWRLK